METFEFPERPKPYPWTTPPDGTVEVVPLQYFVPYADKLEDAITARDQRIAELEREIKHVAVDQDALEQAHGRIATLESTLAATQAALEAKEKGCERLQRRTCGCVVCVCDDEIQCQGCGAKDCDYHTDMREQRDTAIEEVERLRGELAKVREETARA